MPGAVSTGTSWQHPTEPVRIGVSSCLLGTNVRWDGGHKRDAFLSDTLGRFVEWVPVCPEVEVGMGVPREPVRLERRRDAIHMIGTRDSVDHTAAMTRWAEARLRELWRENLSGYVLKKDSPSCGMERVKVYAQTGVASRSGRGLFAGALLDRMPNLPVEEEGRLSDLRLRENFLERVFAYHRLRSLWQSRWTIGHLVAFHTAHKLQLMAHSPDAYRRLGRQVAAAKSVPRAVLRERYEAGLMAALRVVATPGRQANVLQHMLGYVSAGLTPDERDELVSVIDDHRRRVVPLVVPLVLLRHHARRARQTYLLGQTFLAPHPKELMLRNHV
jgi:uncharacterized protein YbgA (DUF1722 family)/uncharacterized protein YbbK (DUF523 family)